MSHKAQKAYDDDAVMKLVETALATSVERRRAFLEKACKGDSGLFDTVLSKVEAEQEMGDFLRDPICPTFEIRHPFEPGQLLDGRFRILREVAEGGMGIVYEAFDERLERRIALKCAKTGFRRRLPPEVRNASDISHPNVCKIFEIHTASTAQGDIDFLTMEFLDGETLTERIRRRPLMESEALAIVVQLCAGLGEAHRKHVVHGDLKSNNVIVATEPDGTVRAVITDFGLARRPEGPPAAPELSSQIGGTPDYMAPELWKGAKPSTSSDIYALGVILRELAAGWTTPAARGAPAPASRRRWDRVISRCTEPDPVKRFSSAGEVAQALSPKLRRWLAAAAAIVSLMVVFPPQTAPAPQEQVQLAVFPFDSRQETAALAEQVSAATLRRLSSIRNGTRTRLTVIPPEYVRKLRADTPEKAREVLRATHVLRCSLAPEGGKVAVVVRLTDARSLVHTKEWKASYDGNETRYIPVALAGIVTGTFHLPVPARAAAVNPSAHDDYQTGLAYLRRTSTVDAGLPLLERAVAKDPDSPLTYAALAEGCWWKYFATNDQKWLERTQEALGEAERRNPDLPEVHRVAGLLKARAGQHEEAKVDYLRAIEIEPRDSDAYRRLAIVYESANELPKALAAFRRAVELDPGYYRNHQALGHFYEERADYRESLKHFQRTVALLPDEPAAHFLLGSAYLHVGQFADSEGELRMSIQLGENPDALNTLGAVLMYEGRDREATEYYLRALKSRPGDYLIWMNLGTAYRRLNLKDEFERANRRGLALAEAQMIREPRDGYVRACLAYMYASLGNRQRAEAEIAQAREFSPNETDVRRVAVKTYERLKRREDSLALLSTSKCEVLTGVSWYPDLADLARDPRFLKLQLTCQSE
jgi:serine/threonine protein kinase/Flp pilus assembly protein TadD